MGYAINVYYLNCLQISFFAKGAKILYILASFFVVSFMAALICASFEHIRCQVTGPFRPNWIPEVESWRSHVRLPWSTPGHLSHASQDWSQLEFSLEFSFQTALTCIKWEEEKGGHIRLEWNSTFPLDCFSVTTPTCWQIKPTAPEFHKQMRGSKKFKSPFSNSLTSPVKWGNIDMAFPHEQTLRAQIFSWLRRCKKPTVSVGGERRFLRQDKDTY